MTSAPDRIASAVALVAAAGADDRTLIGVEIRRQLLGAAGLPDLDVPSVLPDRRRWWRRHATARDADPAAATTRLLALIAAEAVERLATLATVAAELDRRDVPSLEAIGLHAAAQGGDE